MDTGVLQLLRDDGFEIFLNDKRPSDSVIAALAERGIPPKRENEWLAVDLSSGSWRTTKGMRCH